MHTALTMAGPLALMPDWLSAEGLLKAMGDYAFWGAVAVIFAECGLLIGFFLPGDSLLFTVGLFIGLGKIDQNIAVACLIMTVAAFVGNVVGYEIGHRAGPALFSKPDSRLFRREYVDKTEAFFERYGNRAIFLARFTPIVRTFITVTAGIGRMDRRRYMVWSGAGAVAWAAGVTLLGYFLGSIDFVKNNVEAILILLVLVSVMPIVIEVWRERRKGSAAAASDADEGSLADTAASALDAAVDVAVTTGAAAVDVVTPGDGGRHRA